MVMNFDTRTTLDVIRLNDELKEKLLHIIDTELGIMSSQFDMTDDTLDTEFLKIVTPILHGYLVRFFKNELKNTDLLFLKKLVNLKNVDYKTLVEEVTKI
jgi:hypothetical protein